VAESAGDRSGKTEESTLELHAFQNDRFGVSPVFPGKVVEMAERASRS